jgi:hypothetical protein
MAIPQRKLHKRAFGVVVPQYACDEREKVQQPSLRQRLADSVFAVPFAQNVVHHVRMRDVVA